MTYCFIPAAVFVNINETSINMSVIVDVTMFIVLFIGSQMILSAVIARLMGLDRMQSAVFKNSVVLFKSGGYLEIVYTYPNGQFLEQE